MSLHVREHGREHGRRQTTRMGVVAGGVKRINDKPFGADEVRGTVRKGMGRSGQAERIHHRFVRNAAERQNRHAAATGTEQTGKLSAQKGTTVAHFRRRRPVLRRQATDNVGDADAVQTPGPARVLRRRRKAETHEALEQKRSGIIPGEGDARSVRARPPRCEPSDQQPRAALPPGRHRGAVPSRFGFTDSIHVRRKTRASATAWIMRLRRRREVFQWATACGSTIPCFMASSVSSTSLEMLSFSNIR